MRNGETVPVCPSRAFEQSRLHSVFGVVKRFFRAVTYTYNLHFTKISDRSYHFLTKGLSLIICVRNIGYRFYLQRLSETTFDKEYLLLGYDAM
jgi:hypothetical protein